MARCEGTDRHWLSEEELAAIGINTGTFRMSVGPENVEDLTGTRR